MASHKNNRGNPATGVMIEKAKIQIDKDRNQTTAQSKAQDAINYHVCEWLGIQHVAVDPAPNLSSGGRFGQPSEQVSFEIEIQNILRASEEIKSSDIFRQLKELETLKTDVEALRDKLKAFDIRLLSQAAHAAGNVHQGLEGRILNALGIGNAAYLSIDGLAVGLAAPIAKLSAELERRGPTQKGRPREEAAHRVAGEAGKLYVKVTRALPTQGESLDGLTGKFAPFLRDLFDAFGWDIKTLRTFTDTAIEEAKTVDLRHVENGLLGQLFTHVPK